MSHAWFALDLPLNKPFFSGESSLFLLTIDKIRVHVKPGATIIGAIIAARTLLEGFDGSSQE